MSTKEKLPIIKDVLDEIKAIYDKNNGKIKESSYKQTIFEKFFEQLGYINDYSRGIEEIRFEVPDGNNKFIDIVVGKNIIVEVKGSHISIDNVDFMDQAFRYNSHLGKKIVVVTNFKRMKIFKIGKNNLLADLDLFDYDDQTIRELFFYLHSISFRNEEKFDYFYNEHCKNFIYDYIEAEKILYKLINGREKYLLPDDRIFFENFIKRTNSLFEFLRDILNHCELKETIIEDEINVENLKVAFYNFLSSIEYGDKEVIHGFLKEFIGLFLRINNIKESLKLIVDINVIALNLDIKKYNILKIQ